MGKYLTREQVVADFKLNIYPSLKEMLGDDFEEIKEFWDKNLEGHLSDKTISISQRTKWKLTENDLI
mgnify:CR=1 FL=1